MTHQCGLKPDDLGRSKKNYSLHSGCLQVPKSIVQKWMNRRRPRLESPTLSKTRVNKDSQSKMEKNTMINNQGVININSCKHAGKEGCYLYMIPWAWILLYLFEEHNPEKWICTHYLKTPEKQSIWRCTSSSGMNVIFSPWYVHEIMSQLKSLIKGLHLQKNLTQASLLKPLPRLS